MQRRLYALDGLRLIAALAVLSFVIDTLQADLHSYAVLAIATISALVIAALINRLVERPFGPRLRRAVERSLTPTS